MSDTNPKVDALFDKLTDWRTELEAMRSILLASPLTEEFKWRSPVYTYEGGNIAIIWGFKDRATLGFFKGALLKDPENILERPGDNSRSSRIINFTDPETIENHRKTLEKYIAEAIELQKSGAKVEFAKDDLAYPEELTTRLDQDDSFRTAFETLTPGRRRSWLLHFSGAKQAKTRISRIEKATAKILAGKGMNDR